MNNAIKTIVRWFVIGGHKVFGVSDGFEGCVASTLVVGCAATCCCMPVCSTLPIAVGCAATCYYIMPMASTAPCLAWRMHSLASMPDSAGWRGGI